MFCKELEISINLEKNQALLWRLPHQHSKHPIVEKDFKKRKAGYNGESTVYYHLSFLKDKKYQIFYDVRLPLYSNYFQIDFLILTKNYILLVEVKNISGFVTIDPFIRQLTRTYKGITEGFSDPISQVQRQKLFLQKWFSVHKLNHPPIEHLVVFSNPATILDYAQTPSADSPYRNIIHAQNMIEKIKEFNNKYGREVVSDKELSKLKKALLKHHEEAESDLLDVYAISKDELLTGVRCESCNAIPMVRVSASWCCVTCGVSSKDAHIASIREYFLLMSTQLTNKELRAFIHLNSRNTAYKILKSLQLDTQGDTKSVVYSKRMR